MNVPWRTYQFPDFLWPEELRPLSEYPTGQQVQQYIRAYAEHFGLLRHIRLNSKVLRLRWHPGSCKWEAVYCDSAREKFYKGAENFAGLQLHAKNFTETSAVSGRRVLIVGAGKTALDCVCSLVASRTASSVTMLYRQAHWPMPRSILGFSIRNLLFNRAIPAMLPPYYTASPGARAVHAAARPLKRLFWKSMEAVISRKFHIRNATRPHVPLPADLFYGGQILDDRSLGGGHLGEGDGFTTLRGEINSFVRHGVILQDGNFLPVDAVLYCTGYEKTYEYFDGDIRSRLGLQKDGLYLYRNCIPPGVPHLAFVGSEVSTYSNILTYGLQALWLSQVLSGGVKLPARRVMEEDIRAQQHWRRQVMPAQRGRGAVLMLYGMQYHDQLLRDMGAQPRRKGLNLLAECFGAYTPEDYSELMAGCGPAAERNPVTAAADPAAKTESSALTSLGGSCEAAGGAYLGGVYLGLPDAGSSPSASLSLWHIVPIALSLGQRAAKEQRGTGGDRSSSSSRDVSVRLAPVGAASGPGMSPSLVDGA
ncbi:hypothetical protein GPECTOR_14g24 [Gonium pectorale]|uniref:Flavin-containing monooxygenase n=1 Tax=Gonium pectorale TaxID=33097 RepID=A0A150GMJ9_GONPE|nr:hypothetical protein GPECTOR_14g24 [Gonium pectorale]|eukprot:KXZ50998.1 hypothetical protein GPECTOR_14g24 [Gonium pectorale]